MAKSQGGEHFAAKYFDDIDQASETDNYFTPVLQAFANLADLRAARVLDVGCGTGVFVSPVVRWGCAGLYGVDGPTTVASRALQRGYTEVRRVNDLNRDRLPFEDGSFELVICKDVFEHLTDPAFALDEIRRVLTPTGLLLLHVPNHFPLYGRLKFLVTNDIDTFRFFPGASRWSFPHIRFFEHSDFTATIRSRGFDIVSDLSGHFPVVPWLGRFRRLRPYLSGLASRHPNQWAGGFTVAARVSQP